MSKRVICVVLAIAALASPALAKEPCPPNKYHPYPWLIEGPMYGDQYAEIYIDINKAGKPIDCRMGQNNIAGDDKFFVCQAFLGQLTTAPPGVNPTADPPPANLPPNSPIRATIHRSYLAFGPDHQKAERKARKEFFQQHPEERPECYPDGD